MHNISHGRKAEFGEHEAKSNGGGRNGAHGSPDIRKKFFVFLGLPMLASLLTLEIAKLINDSYFPGHTFDTATYLVFHNMTEILSSTISISIFYLGWYSYKETKNPRDLFLSMVFLSIGIIDIFHLLSYAGMPTFVTANSTDKAIKFWLSARIPQALAILIGLFMPSRSRDLPFIRPFSLVCALSFIVGVFLVVIYRPGWYPTMFVNGQGLTQTKKMLEYLVVALCSLALVKAVWDARTGSSFQIWYIIAGLSFFIFSEISFTMYSSAFDIYNLLGHVLKVGAMTAFFMALFVSGIVWPHLRLKVSEASLKKVNRALLTLSNSNEVLVRAKDEQELLDKVSDILIDIGGFRAVCILTTGAPIDPGTEADKSAGAGGNGFGSALMVPRGMKKGLLKALRNSLANGPKDGDPMFEAMKKGRPFVVKDLEKGPKQIPWRTAALRAGHRSFIGLPLTSSGKRIGVICILADTRNAFDDDEVRLLMEMADDMSYGLTAFRTSRERVTAQKALSESERKFIALVSNLPGMAYRSRPDDNRTLEFASDGAMALTGHPSFDLTGGTKKTYMDVVVPEDRPYIQNGIKAALRDKRPFQLVYRIRTADGSAKWVLEQGHGVYSQDGMPLALEGFISDITERKKVEEITKQRVRDEVYSFLASAIPAFASNVPSQARVLLMQTFGKRFEDTVKPRFDREIKEKKEERARTGGPVDIGSQGTFQEYQAWLLEVLANYGVSTEVIANKNITTIQYTSCPWVKEASGNPIFCLMCRTIVYRSYGWTGLSGEPNQRTSIAGGSDRCAFDFVLPSEGQEKERVL